ncbi:MAG TPA: DEAD/DEAH box helicase family protein [Nitrososphaera sp.]|nr:DEAD/DEAH box helicase family protein [Nitrososphaera sp.]
MQKAILRYDRGTIVIESLAHIPFATRDPRINALRAQALYYPDIIEYLKKSGIEYDDRVFSPDDSGANMAVLMPLGNQQGDSSSAAEGGGASSTSNRYDDNFSQPLPLLRDYQQRAIDNWIEAGMRGCVVLPTGSGKTLVGIMAIEKANAASLVVVPTLDLMDQWTATLSKYFCTAAAGRVKKIGNLGGGSEEISPITVSTYDSAYLRAAFLGNKFQLVVFDEVHHLAAPGYRMIAEQMAAPFRLGLTATIEREDSLHVDLPRLVGGVVFQVAPDVLARQKHLAEYEVERRKVELSPEELAEYRANMQKYHEGLEKLGWGGRNTSMRYTLSLEKLIMMSGRNPLAREALLARNRAANVALNARSKLEELKEILAENKGSKSIIFTQHNDMVYEISDRFLIPFITHKTGKEERQDVLKGFKEGRYMAIVTSKVLDEGVDVPDAELGIIVSGTGSAREFIQRLGRLLRPKPRGTGNNDDEGSKKARLIELVSSETREETITSAKRRRALKKVRENNNSGDNNSEKEEAHGNSVC